VLTPLTVEDELGRRPLPSPTVQPSDQPAPPPCKICASATEPAGVVHGRFSGRDFGLRRCPSCGFAFVHPPRTDFAAIYSDAYYAGKGADPLVDYVTELDRPGSALRQYEWRGVHERVRSLIELAPGARWLDYGCGTGGLVRHLRAGGAYDAVGFEQGWSVPRLREHRIPFVEEGELAAQEGSFDVVTAIEVLEHVIDPVTELRRMRALLRPGGLLFVTTGNAEPYAQKLSSWRYVIPEIHVSLFEPRSLALAMREAGLAPATPGFGPGWPDIIRFKLLKNLKRRNVSGFDRLVPWPAVTRVIDRRFRLSAHPVGWAT
jgi:SAM-dependent methyltransferase